MTLKISTADFPDEEARYAAAIERIAAHVEAREPDLLILPEMPFTPWVFHYDVFDQSLWDETVERHAAWLERFSSMTSVPLIASRPVNAEGRRLNQAFYMDRMRSIRPLRSKYYLPNDFPAVEQPWFDIGEKPGEVFEISGHRVSVQLCSEIMYAEVPRELGLKATEILVQARATGPSPKWRAAAVLGAATAGAFVVGANRLSIERDWFSGGSWVYDPEGALLAETSSGTPIVTVEIDASRAKAARAEYPRTMFASYDARRG